MKVTVGRIAGTRQDSAEYRKKGDAKATVDEAKALALAVMGRAILVARFAVLLAVVACGVAGLALLVALRR